MGYWQALTIKSSKRINHRVPTHIFLHLSKFFLKGYRPRVKSWVAEFTFSNDGGLIRLSHIVNSNYVADIWIWYVIHTPDNGTEPLNSKLKR